MLTAGVVPHSEPDIHVGIVLPEDQETKIVLTLPEVPRYSLRIAGRNSESEPGSKLLLKYSRDHSALLLNGKPLSGNDEVKLYVQQRTQSLKPGQGIRVNRVIAGRGFHWKKYIAVSLPGNIIVKPYQNSLLLINELPLEHYVMCVATSEMGSACPSALIEAQTITARSWILANVEQKHRHLGMDVCNDDCCQRYQGSTHLSEHSVEGALNTWGKVLIHDGKICDARYSKSCGGMMERFETIWGGEEHAYLQSLPDSDCFLPELQGPLTDEQNFFNWVQSTPKTFCSSLTVPESVLVKYLGSVDESGTYFRWTVKLSQQSLLEILKKQQGIEAAEILQIIPLKRGPSGRLYELEIVYRGTDQKTHSYRLTSEYEIRKSLHANFLYSSAFIVKEERDHKDKPLAFVLKGAGWGHGVGLCQIGALGMALKHYRTEQILEHYYPNSIVEKIY